MLEISIERLIGTAQRFASSHNMKRIQKIRRDTAANTLGKQILRHQLINTFVRTMHDIQDGIDITIL